MDDIKHEEYAIITAKDEKKYKIEITYIQNKFLTVKCFAGEKEIGFLNTYYAPNNRVFLCSVSVRYKYRNLGIASRMMKIALYYLSFLCPNQIIRGGYEPYQPFCRIDDDQVCSESELDFSARKFYQANGFDIVNLKDLEKYKEKYKELNITDDFKLGEELKDPIVIRRIPQNLNIDIDFYTEPPSEIEIKKF